MNGIVFAPTIDSVTCECPKLLRTKSVKMVYKESIYVSTHLLSLPCIWRFIKFITIFQKVKRVTFHCSALAFCTFTILLVRN